MNWSRRNAFRRHGSSLAVVLVGLLAFSAAAALGALVADSEPTGPAGSVRDEMPDKDWQPVATGTDANYGRYEIVRGRASGEDCVGIRLRDHEPPGIGERGAIYHFCGADAAFDAAFIRGEQGTLVYGRASEAASAVTLDARRSTRRARISETAGHRYFVVSHPRRIRSARVQAVSPEGRVVAARTADR